MTTNEQEDYELILDIVRRVHGQLHINYLSRKKTRGQGTHVEEWYGPCARCQVLRGDGGRDRLAVFPYAPPYGVTGRGNYPLQCRQCGEGGSVWYGDIVSYAMDALDMDYREAMEWIGRPVGGKWHVQGTARPLVPKHFPFAPPAQTWQERAWELIDEAVSHLWSAEWADALGYLKGRGLTDETIKRAKLGFLPDQERYEAAEKWGQEGSRMRLVRGFVIPELHLGDEGDIQVWSIAIRRLEDDLDYEQELAGGRIEDRPGKYWFIRGCAKWLYGVDGVRPGKPVVMVEGQFDALSIAQECGDAFTPVATQSTTGGRQEQSVWKLATASHILLCFDPDQGGADAVAYWMRMFKDKAYPWRPEGGDINALLQKGVDIRDWLETGIAKGKVYHALLSNALQSKSEHFPGRGGTLSHSPITTAETPYITTTDDTLSDRCVGCGLPINDDLDFEYDESGNLLCPDCVVIVKEAAQ